MKYFIKLLNLWIYKCLDIHLMWTASSNAHSKQRKPIEIPETTKLGFFTTPGFNSKKQNPIKPTGLGFFLNWLFATMQQDNTFSYAPVVERAFFVKWRKVVPLECSVLGSTTTRQKTMSPNCSDMNEERRASSVSYDKFLATPTHVHVGSQ